MGEIVLAHQGENVEIQTNQQLHFAVKTISEEERGRICPALFAEIDTTVIVVKG